MKPFLFALFLALLLSAEAPAQTPTVVNLSTATLSWQYTQGAVAANEFRMKCGTTTGVYTRTTVIADVTLRSILIRSAIGGSGVWFCKDFAANKFGESAGSNEVNFDAGDSPSSSVSNLAIQP